MEGGIATEPTINVDRDSEYNHACLHMTYYIKQCLCTFCSYIKINRKSCVCWKLKSRILCGVQVAVFDFEQDLQFACFSKLHWLKHVTHLVTFMFFNQNPFHIYQYTKYDCVKLILSKRKWYSTDSLLNVTFKLLSVTLLKQSTAEPSGTAGLISPVTYFVTILTIISISWVTKRTPVVHSVFFMHFKAMWRLLKTNHQSQ